jgi:hypothetical protein
MAVRKTDLITAAAISGAIALFPNKTSGANPDSVNFNYFVVRFTDSLKANGGFRNIFVDWKNHLVQVDGNYFTHTVPSESSLAILPKLKEMQEERVGQISREILHRFDTNLVAHILASSQGLERIVKADSTTWKNRSELRILVKDRHLPPELKYPEKLEPYYLKGKPVGKPANEPKYRMQKTLPESGKSRRK